MSSDSRKIENGAGSFNALSKLRTLQEALAGINSVLAREGEELSERDLSQLLKELEAAESLADGVENKLDALLKNLEGMLDGLEGTEHKNEGVTQGEGEEPEAAKGKEES